MAKRFKPGDKVAWNSAGGSSTGEVVTTQLRRTTIKRHVVSASESGPQYIVESDKSGKIAAHKPGSLKRI